MDSKTFQQEIMCDFSVSNDLSKLGVYYHDHATDDNYREIKKRVMQEGLSMGFSRKQIQESIFYAANRAERKRG